VLYRTLSCLMALALPLTRLVRFLSECFRYQNAQGWHVQLGMRADSRSADSRRDTHPGSAFGAPHMPPPSPAPWPHSAAPGATTDRPALPGVEAFESVIFFFAPEPAAKNPKRCVSRVMCRTAPLKGARNVDTEYRAPPMTWLFGIDVLYMVDKIVQRCNVQREVSKSPCPSMFPAQTALKTTVNALCSRPCSCTPTANDASCHNRNPYRLRLVDDGPAEPF
jgi:hypothetical protein